MKFLKAFLIALSAILIAGAVFIMGRGIYLKSVDKSSSATKVSTTTSEKSGSGKKKTRAKANPLTKAIVSEAISSFAAQEGGSAKKMYDSMSEEDKDTVAEIIAANVSLDTISELQEYASDEDSNAIIKYAQDNFSEEDLSELQEILEKYD